MDNLILIRHGQSRWNLENRFTGWVDVDLSENGVLEAKEAAKVLKKNDIEIDYVYTSVLKRSIQTAELILDILEKNQLSLTKSWQLNERHYGALQGKNKKETAEIHGAEQVKIWRRSFSTKPPQLNEEEIQIPESWGADIPKVLGESLEDTCKRVIPFWKDNILKEIRSGKKVLISAHGNSLRALLKHLFSISDEKILELEIPTGKPILCKLNDKGLGVEYSYI
ncbi:MAG: phosphoglyceromutase [Halobacteriovoraceae bacterium]|nr:phosphoglyceromutase [Halobacteriovoraceae bacterium]